MSENNELLLKNQNLINALEEIVALEHTECHEWDAVERVIPEMVQIAKNAIRDHKEPVKLEPIAWCREWDGDVSDIGNMIVVFDESECDDGYEWHPLHLHPFATKKQQPMVTELLNKLALTPVDAWRFNGLESIIILGALFAYNPPKELKNG